MKNIERKRPLMNSIHALEQQAAIQGTVVPDKRIIRYKVQVKKLEENPLMTFAQWKQQFSKALGDIADSLPD